MGSQLGADCINGIVVSCLSYYWLTLRNFSLVVGSNLLDDANHAGPKTWCNYGSVWTRDRGRRPSAEEIKMQISAAVNRQCIPLFATRAPSQQVFFTSFPRGSRIDIPRRDFYIRFGEFLFCCITTALVLSKRSLSEQNKSCMNVGGVKF